MKFKAGGGAGRCAELHVQNIVGAFLRDAKMKYHKNSRSGSDGLNVMHKWSLKPELAVGAAYS